MKAKQFLMPLVGNVFEWYEFAIFSSLSVVIGEVFFNNYDPVNAAISGFMIYGIAYIARPFGTLFFGYLGDKYGRKKSLSLSLLVMCISTLLIPFLPTYSQVGNYASLMLILVRMIQGFSLGGEYSSVVTYTCETAPQNRKGLFGSIQAAIPLLAILAGVLTVIKLNQIYNHQEIVDFAWKIAFFVAILLGFFGMYIWFSVKETQEFIRLKESGGVVDNPVLCLFKNHYKILFIAMLSILGVSAINQTFMIGTKTILEIMLKLDPLVAGKISLIMLLLTMFSIAFSGYLCDKSSLFFIRKIYTILFPIMTLGGVYLMSRGGAENTIYPIVGVAMINVIAGLFTGFYSYYLYKNIPTAVRDTGVGLAIAIPNILAGGVGMVTLIKLFQAYSFAGIYGYFILLNIITFAGFYLDKKR
jgi:MHS family proline/betaine transporter-like MFS transporter